MIIGICGLIGSGKDTVAEYLIDNHNFVKISFADKLKDAVAVMFDWDRQMLEGKTEQAREWREQTDTYWTKETGRTITPRLVLQEFGTECMRDGFFDGVWVSLTKKYILDNPNTNFVIPDVRFPNEATMLSELNSELWRVRRGPDPVWFRMYQDIGVEPKDQHASEWAWANSQFTHIFDNDGTIDRLKSRVKDRLASTELQSAEVLFDN